MFELKPARLWRSLSPLTLMMMLSFAASPVRVAVSPVTAPVTAAFAAAGMASAAAAVAATRAAVRRTLRVRWEGCMLPLDAGGGWLFRVHF